MTDEQANEITKEQAIRILHPDTRVEAIDDYEDAGNYEHAYDMAILMAIAALRGPQPDPDTGLVPCGCGGKAGFHYSVMLRDNDCCVACGICGEHSKVAMCEEEARDAWNTAMGRASE